MLQTNLDLILPFPLPNLIVPPPPTSKPNLLHQLPGLSTQPPHPTLLIFPFPPLPNQKLPLLIHLSPPPPTIINPRPLPRPGTPLLLLKRPLPPPHRSQHPLPLLPRPPDLGPLPPQRRLDHPLGLARHPGRGRVEGGREAGALVGAQPGEGCADEGEGFSLFFKGEN